MTVIRIPEPTAWRADGRVYHFGDYRVPQDMPAEHAERAVAEGAASIVTPPPAQKRKAAGPTTS